MDVIIIGAGAAGLMAAKLLSESGFTACVLEARDRIGGRIFSIQKDGCSFEGGAEFIHGNLEVTLSLLGDAGLETRELQGDVWQVIDGHWKQEGDFFEHSKLVIEKLKGIQEDRTVSAFMQENFPGPEYVGLRKGLTSYIEGYYSGEVSKMSAKAFLREWLSEDNQQFRPAAGYGALMNFLANESRKAGAEFKFETVVQQVRWQQGKVEVFDNRRQRFTGEKLLVTVPVGVWTAENNSPGAISYFPALAGKVTAANQLGFGPVIKVLLLFEHAFWEEDEIKRACNVDTANFHMAISNMAIPTWWSQLPEHKSLLTGWLAGPKAAEMSHETEEKILSKSLESVSTIFHIDLERLKQKLRWSKIINWSKDPFTRGSYSYSTLDTQQARRALLEPVENTLFFAGEALYDGPEMGTVEAALTSARQVAEKIINGAIN